VGYAFPSTTSPTGATYHVGPVVTTGSPAAPTITDVAFDVDDLDVTATINATDPTSLVGATYSIEWGDGDSDTSASNVFEHTYAEPGLYAVLARVVDATDLDDYAAAAVQVYQPAAMTPAGVMDEIAARLGTISGLEVSAVPVRKPNPPQAIVTYPDDLAFDETYGRGTDRINIDVVVVVGMPNTESSRNAVSAYAAGAGSQSVKAVLESGTYSAFENIAVRTVQFDPIRIDSVDYLAATFACLVYGKGSL
jgi:hypothetical protein